MVLPGEGCVMTEEEFERRKKEIEDNASPDYCMCGDVITHSAWLAGHQPVSELDYYLTTLYLEYNKQ